MSETPPALVPRLSLFGTATSLNNHRAVYARKCQLFEHNPHCHWCGRLTVFVRGASSTHLVGYNPLAASLDHLVTKAQGRTTLDLDKTVLSCAECNNVRNDCERRGWIFLVMHKPDGSVAYGDGRSWSTQQKERNKAERRAKEAARVVAKTQRRANYAAMSKRMKAKYRRPWDQPESELTLLSTIPPAINTLESLVEHFADHRIKPLDIR